jgi:succinate dehydrogenase / fumarate reductase flavoprotein subunit
MEKYAPNKMELASRDVVSRAEQTEINEGRGVGTDGSGIYLDITVVPKKRTLEALREIVNIGKDFAGVDITQEPILIRPGQHYIMGGVKTDINGATPVTGLYAAGEVACVSVHGGNRLARTPCWTPDLRPPRRRARRRPARGMAMPTAVRRPPAVRRGRDRRDHRPAQDGQARERDQGRARHRDEPPRGGVPRRGRLQVALETVKRLKEEARTAYIDDRGTVFNQDVLGSIELGYMLDAAECTVVAAIERKESRGAQFRTDFPERNDGEYLKHINTSRNGDDIPHVSYSPVTITQWQPEERKY